MVGFKGGLNLSGTQKIEPTGRDERILNGGTPDGEFYDDSDADEDGPPHENDAQTGKRSLKRAGSPSIDSHKPTKKGYALGGKAAISKRICADYDSDDGRIIALKQQGYSDEYVAQKMIQEGRTRYVPKSVGSRWLRLRKALAEAEDEKLDDELSDWHVGDDEQLKTSFDAIETKFEQEIQRIIDRKWKEISDNLASRLRRRKYSAKACHDRFDEVLQGKALMPIEIDPDKEGRKQMREARIAAAKRLRAEQAAEVQRAEDVRKQRLAEKKIKDDEKEHERVRLAFERRELKAEEERIKQEKITDRENVKAAKKAKAEQAKAQADWEEKKRLIHATLLAKLTGRRVPTRRRRAPGVTPRAGRRVNRRSEDDFVVHSDEEEDAVELGDDDEAEASGNENNSDAEDQNLPSDSSPVRSGSISATTTPGKATKKPTLTTKPKVTKETLLNPRSIMTDAELEVVLFERGLPRRTLRETHPQIVARLDAADQDLTTTELTELLSPHFDKGKGSKEAKIKRLQTHEAKKSAAGEAGITSTDLAFKEGYEGYVGEYKGLIEGGDE